MACLRQQRQENRREATWATPAKSRKDSKAADTKIGGFALSPITCRFTASCGCRTGSEAEGFTRSDKAKNSIDARSLHPALDWKAPQSCTLKVQKSAPTQVLRSRRSETDAC